MPQEPLKTVLPTGVVAQPASIGPRQAEQRNESANKYPRRKPSAKRAAPSEPTLPDEPPQAAPSPDGQTHIDYLA